MRFGGVKIPDKFKQPKLKGLSPKMIVKNHPATERNFKKGVWMATKYVEDLNVSMVLL